MMVIMMMTMTAAIRYQALLYARPWPKAITQIISLSPQHGSALHYGGSNPIMEEASPLQGKPREVTYLAQAHIGEPGVEPVSPHSHPPGLSQSRWVCPQDSQHPQSGDLSVSRHSRGLTSWRPLGNGPQLSPPVSAASWLLLFPLSPEPT